MNTPKLKPSHLSAKELNRVMTLCERAHRVTSTESFANHALAVLGTAVKHSYVNFVHFKTRPLQLEKAYSNTIPPETFLAFKSYMHQHPLLKNLINSPQTRVQTLQSVTSPTQFKKTDLYKKIFAPLHINDQLFISLRHKTDLFILGYDRDTPFTETEQLITHLIQPHLQIAWETWNNLRALKHEITLLSKETVLKKNLKKQIQTAQNLINNLTPRQRIITELVAQGLNNRTIAATLHIAPKTVGKHLENIFETLNIHHRTALATLWQQTTF